MILRIYLFALTFSAACQHISGSRVRRLDQTELDEQDHYRVQQSSMHSRSQVPAERNAVANTGMCDSDVRYKAHVQQYVRRFVNTFLRFTNFKDLETSDMDDNDFVYGKLNIRMKVSDLEDLKDYYNGEKHFSLSDLDSYLNDLFYHSRYEHFKGYFDAVFQVLLSVIWWMFEKTSFIIFCNLLVGIAFCYSWYTSKSLKFAVLIAIVGWIAIDGLQKYNNAVKVAEIEQYIRMKRAGRIDASCDPENYSFLQMFLNIFRKDHCQQILEDLEIPHTAHVSFPECLMTSFLNIFIYLPFNCFANIAAASSSAISGNNPVAWFVKPVIATVLMLVICGTCMVFFGAHLSFSNWLLGSISFGLKSTYDGTPRQPRNESKKEQLEAANSPNVNNIYLNLVMPNAAENTTSCRSCVSMSGNAVTYQKLNASPAPTNDRENASESNDNNQVYVQYQQPKSPPTSNDVRDGTSGSQNATEILQPEMLVSSVGIRKRKIAKRETKPSTQNIDGRQDSVGSLETQSLLLQSEDARSEKVESISENVGKTEKNSIKCEKTVSSKEVRVEQMPLTKNISEEERKNSVGSLETQSLLLQSEDASDKVEFLSENVDVGKTRSQNVQDRIECKATVSSKEVRVEQMPLTKNISEEERKDSVGSLETQSLLLQSEGASDKVEFLPENVDVGKTGSQNVQNRKECKATVSSKEVRVEQMPVPKNIPEEESKDSIGSLETPNLLLKSEDETCEKAGSQNTQNCKECEKTVCSDDLEVEKCQRITSEDLATKLKAANDVLFRELGEAVDEKYASIETCNVEDVGRSIQHEERKKVFKDLGIEINSVIDQLILSCMKENQLMCSFNKDEELLKVQYIQHQKAFQDLHLQLKNEIVKEFGYSCDESPTMKNIEPVFKPLSKTEERNKVKHFACQCDLILEMFKLELIDFNVCEHLETECVMINENNDEAVYGSFVQVEASFDNISASSTDNSELDMCEEVASIKKGVRSLLEDDFDIDDLF